MSWDLVHLFHRLHHHECLASTKRSVPTVQFLYWDEEANEAGARPWSLAHTSGLDSAVGEAEFIHWEIPRNGLQDTGSLTNKIKRHLPFLSPGLD